MTWAIARQRSHLILKSLDRASASMAAMKKKVIKGSFTLAQLRRNAAKAASRGQADDEMSEWELPEPESLTGDRRETEKILR